MLDYPRKKERESSNNWTQKLNCNWFYRNKKIIREYYEQLYPNILENLDEMGQFLGTHNLAESNKPKLHHENIENLNRFLTNKEIELI